jgi:hypothetical protein
MNSFPRFEARHALSLTLTPPAPSPSPPRPRRKRGAGIGATLWYSFALWLPLATLMPLQAGATLLAMAALAPSVCGRLLSAGREDSFAFVRIIFQHLHIGGRTLGDGARWATGAAGAWLGRSPRSALRSDTSMCMVTVGGLQLAFCLMLPLAAAFARETRSRRRFLLLTSASRAAAVQLGGVLRQDFVMVMWAVVALLLALFVLFVIV